MKRQIIHCWSEIFKIILVISNDAAHGKINTLTFAAWKIIYKASESGRERKLNVFPSLGKMTGAWLGYDIAKIFMMNSGRARQRNRRTSCGMCLGAYCVPAFTITHPPLRSHSSRNPPAHSRCCVHLLRYTVTVQILTHSSVPHWFLLTLHHLLVTHLSAVCLRALFSKFSGCEKRNCGSHTKLLNFLRLMNSRIM